MPQFSGYLACPNEGCGYNSKLFLDGDKAVLRCPSHKHADGLVCDAHSHELPVVHKKQMLGWAICSKCKNAAPRYPSVDADPDFERVLCICGHDEQRKATPAIPPVSPSSDISISIS